MALRGRHWFVLWLAAVCAALWLVVWRQTTSLRTAGALRDVRARRTVLEGRRSDYQRRIRAATSRDLLIPRARALGLHLAPDSITFYLTLPPAGAPPR